MHILKRAWSSFYLRDFTIQNAPVNSKTASLVGEAERPDNPRTCKNTSNKGAFRMFLSTDHHYFEDSLLS